MQLPVELLLEIIRSAVDTIPIPDVINLRLVNNWFDRETMSCLLLSPRLEQEGFGFKKLDKLEKFGYQPRNLINERWRKFPRHFQSQYLHNKLKGDLQEQCVFTMFMRRLLELPHERRTAEDEHAFIDKLIDAWLCSNFEYLTVRDFLDPTDCKQTLERMPNPHSTGSERTAWRRGFVTLLPTALATSAIVRGDDAELQNVLGQYAGEEPAEFLARKGYQFGGICPLKIAAKRGSSAIIRVLIANNCSFWIIDESDRGMTSTSVLELAVRCGNLDGFKTWTEYFKSSIATTPTDADLYINMLRLAVGRAVQHGQLSNADFISHESGLDFSELKTKILFKEFKAAVERGNHARVQYLLDRGGFDHNIKPIWCPNGVFFTTLSLAPNLRLIQILLDNGADPNEPHSQTKQFPLNKACRCADVELMKLLVENGADVRAASKYATRKGQLSLFFLAAKHKSASLAELLLQHGADSLWVWQGKQWEVKESTAPRSDSEKVCYEWAQGGGDKKYVLVVHQNHRK